MNSKSFQQSKENILSRPDKSFIGGIDARIKKLCDKINSLENYYTTSSCSGRIVVMVEKKQKDRELFLFMSHDEISFSELKKELAKILKNKKNKKEIIKFKLDPCILHVACETLEDADILLKKAQLSGWKRNGVISLGRKIVVELNSTEKLEFPILKNGKILVDDDFLKLIIQESNKKLKLGWEKIEKLEKSL
jgi:tRNA wybutosine-synthesizing protein 3